MTSYSAELKFVEKQSGLHTRANIFRQTEDTFTNTRG